MCPQVSFALLSVALTASAFAQGPLTPSGAPAPSMRSLDQVQPRTPIPGNSAGYTISQPGSYYLTGNLTVASGNGITVTVDNVSIDLNGFTIASTSATGSGFGISLAAGRSHVAVSNGHIRGTTTYSGGTFTAGGFVSGIDYNGTPPRNVRVENVSVSGTVNYGIDLGADRSSAITSCTVRTCQQIGLRAGTVSDSAALEIGTTSISAQSASNAIGTLANGSGTGVQVTDATLGSVAGQVTALQNAVNNVAASSDPRTRIPAGGSTYVINSSGSYVLAGNITVPDGNAIIVNADHVVLDLNGFTLTCIGGANNGAGVIINGLRNNVTVRNGHIVGGTSYNGSIFASSGFATGIFASNGAHNIQVEKVSVYGAQRGIFLSSLDDSVLVQDCTVNVIAGTGITAAVVKNCVARTCHATALQGRVVSGCIGESVANNGLIGQTVSDSTGTTSSANTNHVGLSAETAANCIGRSTGGGGGLSAFIATNSRGFSVSAVGLATSYSATGCAGFSTDGTGLSTQMASLCQGDSTNGVGLVATLAVTCRGSGVTPLIITNRYNMP